MDTCNDKTEKEEIQCKNNNYFDLLNKIKGGFTGIFNISGYLLSVFLDNSKNIKKLDNDEKKESSKDNKKNIFLYNFVQNEDFKIAFKEMMKPIISIIYNEFYIYIWLICIFILFILVIILANLIILLRFINRHSHFYCETN